MVSNLTVFELVVNKPSRKLWGTNCSVPRKSLNSYPAHPSTLKYSWVLVHRSRVIVLQVNLMKVAPHNRWNPQSMAGRTTRASLGFRHIWVPIQLQRSRKMEEAEPCSEQATNDQKQMLHDRKMALDELDMNSDKVPKYIPGFDLLGARKNSVNGVIIQKTAAVGIDALIANDLPVVMDVLLTQHLMGRIIAGDGQEQREAAVVPPQMKFILAGNSGLSNLIGEEFIDRLQKAQKVTKAIRVVQNQQRIQPRPAYNHFAQVPRNIPMTIFAQLKQPQNEEKEEEWDRNE
ncbi:MAG: hypothetical protein EZS28_024692 [Streblomastix strix]|uniref:Uncharacterized protein n=1 Tax=Streblomastix strix TaxID=222440 RepID=A0A5J4VB91_9EUKA|nr:MAG: hypothetical protein EZS28_024692 [Streblomastix strix]